MLGPEFKIDLPVKKYSDVSKVNRVKSPLFFPLESLETRFDKFSNGLDKFSNGLERLKTRLEPRSSKFSRIEDRVSSIELREPVNLHLSGTVGPLQRSSTVCCNHPSFLPLSPPHLYTFLFNFLSSCFLRPSYFPFPLWGPAYCNATIIIAILPQDVTNHAPSVIL